MSSFHFPPNVQNNGSQQQNMQQQHSPNDAVSPPTQNILPSPENISAPQNDEVMQQESNPTFDGTRRSTRGRTQAQHPDAEYFRTLEMERQAHSATLSESHYASFDTCVQAENTYQAFEETQQQQMLLCANVEKLCSYTAWMHFIVLWLHLEKSQTLLI